MKIALITPGFSRDENDWAIPALQTLATRLAETAEVHVFSLRYPAAGRYQLGRVRHRATGGAERFGLASLPIWWQTVRAIVEEHRRGPFDLLHAFWVDEPALVAVLAGRITGRPVIASVGGGELTWLPAIHYGTQGSRWRRWLVRFSLQGAGLVTAGSPYQCDLCRRQGVAEERLRFAPLGVDCEQFRPAPAEPGWERPTLIQAASLVAVKRQEWLLEILGRVKEAIPAVHLILAGSGPLENSLRESAAALNLADNITWQPKTAHPDMTQVYQQAHLYLQTSYHESQGMAVLEAMACGRPVLGTPVGLVRELACLPAQASAEALAAQVVTLFKDKEQYLAGRQQAHQIVERDFCLPVTTGRFLQLYQTLL